MLIKPSGKLDSQQLLVLNTGGLKIILAEDVYQRPILLNHGRAAAPSLSFVVP